MFGKRLYSLIEKLAKRNHSPQKLAITVCLGIYIGLSPFIGLRTLITLACGWLFALDLAALFAISFFVHNPWTIIPLYTLNHVIGQWLFGLFNIDGMTLDPLWVEQCSTIIKEYTGITGLSFSAFLIGGNLLGLSISIMLYPLVKRLFSAYLLKKNSTYTSKTMV